MNQFLEEFRELDTDFLLSRRALGRDAMSTEAHEAIEQVLKERNVDCPPIPTAPITLDMGSLRVKRPQWVSVAGGLVIMFIGGVFIEFFKRTWVGVAVGAAGLTWILFAWLWRESLDPDARAVYDDKKAIQEGALTDLMQAAGAGDLGRLQELIRYGVNVNERSLNGSTALMFAARNNHVDVVRLLLAAGADSQIKTDKGNTAHNFAAKAGHQQVLQILSIK